MTEKVTTREAIASKNKKSKNKGVNGEHKEMRQIYSGEMRISLCYLIFLYSSVHEVPDLVPVSRKCEAVHHECAEGA